MFKHLTFEGVEKKNNKECNIPEKAIIMKENEKITLQKSINNKVLCITLCLSFFLEYVSRQVYYYDSVSYTHLGSREKNIVLK